MTGDDLTLKQAREWCSIFGGMYRNRREWVLRCFEAGMSKTAIADRTGLGRGTVKRWIEEEQIRAELGRAVDHVEPSPGGLAAIQARIHRASPQG